MREEYAKGKRGIVYVDSYKGKKIAIKTKNPKSTTPGRIEIEAAFLEKLNKHGIGPKFYFFKDGELGMEFISGEHFIDYIKNKPKEKILRVVKLLEKQVKKMDKLKIEKKEMMRPFKNVIVRDDKPVLIDFERCRYSDDPKNMRQFEEFLKERFLHTRRLLNLWG